MLCIVRIYREIHNAHYRDLSDELSWKMSWFGLDHWKTPKVYQLLAQGRWFSQGTTASSTTKTGRHDIAEILLKVALNTKNSNSYSYKNPTKQCRHDQNVTCPYHDWYNWKMSHLVLYNNHSLTPHSFFWKCLMLLSKISFVVIVLCYKVNMMIIFIVCSLNPNELLVYWIRTRIYKKKKIRVFMLV